jgi:hypothetical protein
MMMDGNDNEGSVCDIITRKSNWTNFTGRLCMAIEYRWNGDNLQFTTLVNWSSLTDQMKSWCSQTRRAAHFRAICPFPKPISLGPLIQQRGSRTLRLRRGAVIVPHKNNRKNNIKRVSKNKFDFGRNFCKHSLCICLGLQCHGNIEHSVIGKHESSAPFFSASVPRTIRAYRQKGSVL